MPDIAPSKPLSAAVPHDGAAPPPTADALISTAIELVAVYAADVVRERLAKLAHRPAPPPDQDPQREGIMPALLIAGAVVLAIVFFTSEDD
ncbi:hypothetical protein LBMAG53_09840 [Planctomycetota bacterium]|nr:hypothetical protein LBMAG53_09840 [Planctomycetota bacterium]